MSNFMNMNPRNLNVFKAPEQVNDNSNIYKTMPDTSVSEDGMYHSVIRIVYNVYDMNNSIVELQTYNLHDENGYFRVNSALSYTDRNCPIFKTWKKLHYAVLEDGKTPNAPVRALGDEIFDKQFSRWCLIQVVEDANKPELVGKYMFWKLPKFIWESMSNKMNPTDPKKAPVPVMDFLLGRAIEINVKPGPKDPAHPEREKREISYNPSEITDEITPITRPDGTSFLTDDEQAILDTYIDMLTAANKNKDAKKRDTALAKLASDPITEQVSKLYDKVAAELQTFCPDLGKEIAYNYEDKNVAAKGGWEGFWDAATTARVKAFCDAALEYRRPWEPKIENINEAGKETPTADAQSAQPQVANSSNEELPF